jgi:hypothetical protein
MQHIERVAVGIFKTWWDEKPNEITDLDFNPLLNEFDLRNRPYSLLHWQGVPFGYRQWGAYDCLEDNYISLGTEPIEIFKPSTLLQIPDQFIKLGNRPSAVICYQGAISGHNGFNKILATIR